MGSISTCRLNPSSIYVCKSAWYQRYAELVFSSSFNGWRLMVCHRQQPNFQKLIRCVWRHIRESRTKYLGSHFHQLGSAGWSRASPWWGSDTLGAVFWPVVYLRGEAWWGGCVDPSTLDVVFLLIKSDPGKYNRWQAGDWRGRVSSSPHLGAWWHQPRPRPQLLLQLDRLDSPSSPLLPPRLLLFSRPPLPWQM